MKPKNTKSSRTLCKSKKNCADSFQEKIVGGLEAIFHSYGITVAKHPIIAIVMSLIVFGLLSAGNLVRKIEVDGIKMWLPEGSQFRLQTELLSFVTSRGERSNYVIIYSKSGNVLSADNLRDIYKLRAAIVGHVTINGTTWNNRCKRIPMATQYESSQDQMLWPDEVCEAEKTRSELTSKVCDESHIFEIWANNGKFDEQTQSDIDALNDDQVLAAVNDDNLISGLTQNPLKMTFLGGEIKREDGRIVAAQAMQMQFNGKYFDGNDENLIKEYELQLEFEQGFLDVVQNASLGEDLVCWRKAARSPKDINDEAIGGDLQLFVIGYVIVIFYVMLMLGKFNFLENRILVSLAGITSVLMGILSSFGLSSLIGIFYSSLNNVLPFMLLGIGIDDMFVIAQSFDRLFEQKTQKDSLTENVGLCMKYAGVAITITSLTNLLAFSIASTTILPALQSFCIHAAFGILFVFLYMISFFLGFFVLDQRRVADKRDAIFCCWKKDDWKSSKCNQNSILAICFSAYGRILVKPIAKAIVLVVSAIFLSISIWRLTELKADFDTTWFIQEGSYLRDFMEAKNKYFESNGGIKGDIYMVDIEQLEYKIDDILDLQLSVEQLSLVHNIVVNSTKGSFHESFSSFVTQSKPNFPSQEISSQSFYSYLSEFLFTTGRSFQDSLIFIKKLKCENPAPKPVIVTISYHHEPFKGASEHIDKINELEESVAKHQSSLEATLLFPMAPEYGNFKVIEIINQELLPNFLLALSTMFLSTLFLTANPWTSVLVMVSVIFSLINVGGFMEIWGLSLDTIAAILISIAMGLTVDYSVHIGHAFMVAHGSRDDRASMALMHIGPAVMNGGFSTFLAFVTLVTSQSYIFKTFFKIFLLIVVFGLFHGLLFLPALLSLVGPSSSSRVPSSFLRTVTVAPTNSEHEQKKDTELF